jgi:metal-responsive CopG/Arc/MetJ family transcriptional regulator
MKTRINVWIATRSYESLNELSIRDGRSLSDLLREAIRDYLESHKDRLGAEHGSGIGQQKLDSKPVHSP